MNHRGNSEFDARISEQMHREMAFMSISKLKSTAALYLKKSGSREQKKVFAEDGYIQLPPIIIEDKQFQANISLDELGTEVTSITGVDLQTQTQTTYYLVRTADNNVAIVDEQLNSWTEDDEGYSEMVRLSTSELSSYIENLNRHENLPIPRHTSHTSSSMMTRFTA